MTLSHVISLECPGTAATQDTRVARRSTKCTQARVGQGGMQPTPSSSREAGFRLLFTRPVCPGPMPLRRCKRLPKLL